jgi:sugar phosphate isomerase/epimerase
MIRTAFYGVVFLFAALQAASGLAAEPAAAGLPNPFFAMDTAFQRPGLTREQQFDLVKELGYAGIGWTEPPAQLSAEQALEKVKNDLPDIESRGLKMFTIYCTARVTQGGDLAYSPRLPAIMEILKGHDTIVWLHIGGKGPAFDPVTEQPAIEKLRSLADAAKANQLRIAFYPHIGEWIDHFGDGVKLARMVNRPNFGVTFNLCHCLAVGDEQKIPALLTDAKDVLQVVTISGADSGVTGSKWKQLIQTLDKGTFDTQIVLKTLKQIGFMGPIGFQGYGIKDDARSILAPTIEAWRKLSAAAASTAETQ